MSKLFENAWANLGKPNAVLTKSDKQKIQKEVFKASMGKEGSPWAICTASVGRENKGKYEDCVTEVKGQLGVDKSMTEEQYNKSSNTDEELIDIANESERTEQNDKKTKDVGLGYAGPTPNSGLAAQDLEVDTLETTKLENETPDGTKEKEDVSGPLPNRTQL